MIVWTLAEMLSALRPGTASLGAEGVCIQGVHIDSRSVLPGSLFVALRGERVDGHSYVADAFGRGANVALVSDLVPGYPILDLTAAGAGLAPPVGQVVVRVPDTLVALQQLARARRQGHPALRVVGITGSVGKTTAKEVVATVLAQRYSTLRSTGNQNNEIGLPLSLLALQPQHQMAVLEMGMYALGEIALLADIALPDIGVVMNVGPVHLERLGSIERIAQAKSELIRALPSSGLAVLNGDDPLVVAMRDQARCRVVSFGLGSDNDIWASEITSHGLQGVSFRVQVAAQNGLGLAPSSAQLRLGIPGRHMVMPALAAISVALAEGLTWAEIAAGLGGVEATLRLVPRPGIHGITLLDDAYNASPASMLASLDLLAELPGRHVAVLGDMLELGDYEVEGHYQVGRGCARMADTLVAVGVRAKSMVQSALAAGMAQADAYHVDDTDAAISLLTGILRQGDVVLIKGSRGMAMERIVLALGAA